MKDYSAWSFLCLRVPERAKRVQRVCKSVFPVKASPLFPTGGRTRMEMPELYAHADTLSRFGNFFLHRLLFFRVTLRKRWQKWTPCSAVESRKALRSWLHSQCGNAHPLLFLPPFLLQSVWTTPKQEVHFLFFLKKDLAASVFSSKLTCATHYPLTLVCTCTALKRFPRVRTFKRNYSSIIKLYKDISQTCFESTRMDTADSI